MINLGARRWISTKIPCRKFRFRRLTGRYVLADNGGYEVKNKTRCDFGFNIYLMII